MRNAIRSKRKVCLSALAAAGFGAWAGAPAAHGDFSFNVDGVPVASGYSPTSSPSAWPTIAASTLMPTNYVSDGTTYSVFVFSAQNLGTGAVTTGTEITALHGFADTGGPSTFSSSVGALGMAVFKSGTLYTVDVDGTQALASANSSIENDGNYGTPVYGDIAGGTFFGVAEGGPWTSDLVADVDAGEAAAGGTQAVYINAQTTEYTPFGDTKAKYLSQSLANLDPQFKNGSTIHSGSSSVQSLVDNGTIHSLEVDEITTSGAGAPNATDVGGVPFANIVVPYGTTFTVHGTLGGEIGGLYDFGQVVTFATVTTTTSSLTISLTGTAPVGSNSIGTVSVHGSNGEYVPATAAVTGAAQTTGYLSVNGFNPASDIEVYGLDASGETSLTTLVADLNAALQVNNPGATAETVTALAVTDPKTAALLSAAGDNVELQFDAGPTGSGFPPSILAYDLSKYTSNGTVTISSITVVPEPTMIGALVLGGAGLLSRRRRRQMA